MNTINLIFFIIFAIFSIITMAEEAAEECYIENENPYLLFATKTAYLNVDQEQIIPIQPPQGCKAKKFWLLARHGSRFPKAEDILDMQFNADCIRQEIIDNHDKGQGHLCPQDISALRDWQLEFSLDKENDLTPFGAKEMRLMALRFKTKFQDILAQNYSENKFVFRHTHKQRTADSAKNYAFAAFPGQNVSIPIPFDQDPILRFYDICSKWQVEVDGNATSTREQKLFAESTEMQKTLESINEKLGFDINNEKKLGYKEVSLMYDICRFEEASDPNVVSPWCALFNDQDLEVLEYAEDLEYYYTNGYGNEINRQMACPLFQDAFNFFLNDSDKVEGRFYFSHSDALLPLLTLLDLYEDSNWLRHDNFGEMRYNRLYRTSLIGSFASNIAFVYYECTNEPSRRFLTMHQERVVRLKDCENEFCDLDNFLEMHEKQLRCDFDQICDNDMESNLTFG